MPDNIHQAGALREFARARGIRIHFSPVILSGDYYINLHGIADLSFNINSDQENTEIFFGKLGIEDQSSLRFYYQDMVRMIDGNERSRRCMMGFYGCVLEHDGNLYPCLTCESISFGSLLTDSFDEIWFKGNSDSIRKQLRAACCPACTSMCYTPAVNALETAELIWRKLSRTRNNSASIGE